MRYFSLFGLVAAFLLVELASKSEIITVGYAAVGESSDVLGWTAFGGVIVFVFYWIKFNEWAGDGQSPPGFRPRPVRHFTTWIRYLGWNTLYGLVMAGAYGAFVFFPDAILQYGQSIDNVTKIFNIEKLLSLLNLDADNLPGTTQLVPTAVMLTTAVWAGMPPFSRFEKRIRLRWQENAAIPLQAKQLVEAFEEEVDGENNFAPDPKIVPDVVKKLAGHPLDVADFTDAGHSLWFLYARTNYLYHMLEKHNRSPIFSRLAERYGSEFKDLEGNILQLRKQVGQRIADIQDLYDHENENQLRLNTGELEKEKKLKPTFKNVEQWLDAYLVHASKAEKAYFQIQKDELKRSLHDVTQDIIQLIVCGVLAVGRSLAQRRELLTSFGLKSADRIVIHLDFVTLTWIALSTIGIVFICSTIYFFLQNYLGHRGGPIPMDMAQVLQWSVFACFMHLTATGGGYIIQRTFEHDRESLKTKKPRTLSPRAQVAEAVWAAVFGASLNVFLLGLFSFIGGNFSQLYNNWWWAAVPGVTAFFAAFYTQNVRRSDRELKKLLWSQSFITGSMALLVFTIMHFDQLGLIRNDGLQSLSWSYVIYGVYAVATSAIVGRALGKSLYIWAVAERYSGPANRRNSIRKSYLFKRGKWVTETGVVPVRAVSVSSSGAELKAPEPLSVNSKGKFKISGRGVRQAVVLRADQEDLSRFFVKFLGDGI
jgi:hypothetical protein